MAEITVKNGKHRGRPCKLEARRNQILVKVSDRELERIRIVAEEYNISNNEALRMAFDRFYIDIF